MYESVLALGILIFKNPSLVHSFFIYIFFLSVWIWPWFPFCFHPLIYPTSSLFCGTCPSPSFNLTPLPPSIHPPAYKGERQPRPVSEDLSGRSGTLPPGMGAPRESMEPRGTATMPRGIMGVPLVGLREADKARSSPNLGEKNICIQSWPFTWWFAVFCVLLFVLLVFLFNPTFSKHVMQTAVNIFTLLRLPFFNSLSHPLHPCLFCKCVNYH